MSTSTRTVAQEWRDHAPELAELVMTTMVNRTDRYGAYGVDGGQITAEGPLDVGRLARHWAQPGSGWVVGLHTTAVTNGECLSKWGAIDIDRHGDEGDPEANERYAKDLQDRLSSECGLSSLLHTSNGAGGFHLRIGFAEAVPTARLHSFLKWLVRDWAAFGLDHEPEVFPKQADIRHTPKQLGNWLRLFGPHHKRDHWSMVWEPSGPGGWLEGAWAVEAIRYHLVSSLNPASRLDAERIPAEAFAATDPRHRSPRAGTPRGQNRFASEDDARHAAEALQYLPGDFVDDYAHWIKVGQTLVGLGDEGLRLWADWSRGSAKYRAGDCEEKWPTFGTEGVQLGSLFAWAKSNGWVPSWARATPPRLVWPTTEDAGDEPEPDHDQGGDGDPGAATEPDLDRGAGPHEAVDDPHRLARLYRDRRCLEPGSGTLTVRYYQGEFYRHAGAYCRVTDQELRAELGGVVKAEFDRDNVRAIEEWAKNGECDKVTGKPTRKPVAAKVTEPLKNNTLGNLASLTLVKASEVPSLPAWLDGPGPWPAAEVLPAPNGLFHLPSLADGNDGFVIDPTPRYFSTFQLGYDVDVNAPEPTNWLQFLGAKQLDPDGRIKQQLWPDPADSDVIDTLQEWMGLQLVTDTSFQKIAALIGPKRSGKGTIARALTALVGAANVAGPTLSGLAGNFGLEPLVGKLVAIIDDARLSSRSDAAIITERLLTISGEGTLTVDQKHRPAWTGKLPTRITMLSNELPRLDDASAALAGRLIIIPFRESFYGKEDRGLDGVLIAELPGILLWAIEGWRRLRERGHLVQPKAGEQLTRQMAYLSSPVSQFIEEECQLEPGRRISCADLFLAWQVWCERNGQKRPGTAQTFGRNLAAAYPGIKVVQPRNEDGVQVRHYEGVYHK